MHTSEKELIMLRAVHHAHHEEFDKALACIQSIIDEDPDDCTAWFNKGHTLRIAGRKEEAYDLFTQLHDEYSERADICFELGLLAKEKGKIIEAEEHFKNCILIEPLSSESRIEIGLLFYNVRNYEKSRKYFADALVFDPGNVIILRHLGLIALKRGNFEEAERWFYESSEHDPSDAETWYNMARLYEEQGRRNDEIACYDRLIALYPEQIVPWLKKGFCYLLSDDLSKSLSCFRMAALLDSNSHLPHLLKGIVLSILDRNEEAVVSLEKAVSLSDGPEVLLQYGRALGACLQYESAMEVFFKIISKYPDNCAAAEGYARSLYLLERYDEVASFCLSQKLRDPDNPFWVITYARVMGWQFSNYDGAITVLREAMKEISGLQIPIVLADLLVYAERNEEARELLLTLVSEVPNDYQVLTRLSSLLAQMKQFDQAAIYFDILIKQRPHDMSLVFLAGQACEQSGNPDRALTLYTDAVTGMPGNPEVWLSRARVMMDLGMYHDAVINATQATELTTDWFDAFLLKGMAEIQTEDYGSARISLTYATSLEKDNADAWGYLGDALFLSGEKEAAKLCYDKALVLNPDDSRGYAGYLACTRI